MKKLVKSFILSFFLLIFLLLGCEKETNNDDSKESLIGIGENSSIELILDSIPKISNPYLIGAYISDPENPDDEKISRYKYEICLAIIDLTKDKEFNESVLKNANLSLNNTVDLISLTNSNPKLKSSLNSNLQIKNLSLEQIKMDFTRKSLNPLKNGEFDEYVLAIYIPNIESADFNKQPIICCVSC